MVAMAIKRRVRRPLEWYKQYLPRHTKKLEILHFNDVYNLEERDVASSKEICAGIARFKTAFDEYGAKDKLVLFSGDFFSPSTLSQAFEGE